MCREDSLQIGISMGQAFRISAVHHSTHIEFLFHQTPPLATCWLPRMGTALGRYGIQHSIYTVEHVGSSHCPEHTCIVSVCLFKCSRGKCNKYRVPNQTDAYTASSRPTNAEDCWRLFLDKVLTVEEARHSLGTW